MNDKVLLAMCAASQEEAAFLASGMVERHLAACVNIIENVSSVYFWQGKKNCEKESVLIIKTTEKAWSSLLKFVEENHSYDLPELVAWPASRLSPPYEEWVKKEVSL